MNVYYFLCPEKWELSLCPGGSGILLPTQRHKAISKITTNHNSSLTGLLVLFFVWFWGFFYLKLAGKHMIKTKIYCKISLIEIIHLFQALIPSRRRISLTWLIPRQHLTCLKSTLSDDHRVSCLKLNGSLRTWSRTFENRHLHNSAFLFVEDSRWLSKAVTWF